MTGNIKEPKYGRLLDDFKVGEVYHHPWEVTLDDGILALFAASFLDPNPLYSSRRFARDLGFRDRVVPPLVLMNFALSFSVHDVSEQTIAHLAYIDMKFPNAAYAGDTITASSQVLGVRLSESKPDRGIVHVRTIAVNQDGAPVVSFERRALMPVGVLEGRAHPPIVEFHDPKTRAQSGPAFAASAPHLGPLDEIESLPRELAQGIKRAGWRGRPRGLFEDFEEGDLIVHDTGRTVGESEHMQLTCLTRNSHPIHYDEVYSRERSFAGTRVVEGGLVFAWVCSLASRDTTANALWEIGYDRGSHPAPVLAGDTLYSASRVIEKRDYNKQAGVIRFKLIGVKNERPAALLIAGVDLFEGKAPQKVFEIERAILLPKRSAIDQL
ncbi:MAG: MaoC family dehydratase [Blastocatellia bacterium]|nr:MaoC family dehydratase [Blastocatellia bacterium]